MDTLNSMLCLNEKFSTTRNLTTKKPIIENHPDDKFETVLFLPEIEGRKEEGGLRTQGYFKKSLPDKTLVTVITLFSIGKIFGKNYSKCYNIIFIDFIMELLHRNE